MLRTLIAIAVLATIANVSPAAAPDPDAIVKAADLALQEIMSDSAAAIPQEVLADAHGLVIWPKSTTIKLIGGATFKTGVLVTRSPDGSWSMPKFVKRNLGSVGLQAGYVRGCSIQVYLTRKKLDDFLENGSFLVGVGMVARLNQPLNKKFNDLVNNNPNSVVQVYSTGSGISGGVVLQTDFRKVDRRVESDYYGTPNAVPPSAANLLANLQKYCQTDAREAVGLTTRLPSMSVSRRQ